MYMYMYGYRIINQKQTLKIELILNDALKVYI